MPAAIGAFRSPARSSRDRVSFNISSTRAITASTLAASERRLVVDGGVRDFDFPIVESSVVSGIGWRVDRPRFIILTESMRNRGGTAHLRRPLTTRLMHFHVGLKKFGTQCAVPLNCMRSSRSIVAESELPSDRGITVNSVNPRDEAMREIPGEAHLETPRARAASMRKCSPT